MVTTDKAFADAMARARHPDAEAAVIGGCLNKPDALDWLALDREAYADVRHRHVWDAMLGLRRDSTGVDEVTVIAALKRAGLLEAVGGEAFVYELGLRTPTADNLEHYADVLREHQLNRRLLILAGSIPGRFCADMSGEELLGDIQQALNAADPGGRGDAEDIADAVTAECRDIAAFLKARQAGSAAVVGVPTGIEQLDRQVGGLIVGAPTVLGARPGEGKSTFALNVANHAARSGLGVHLFTLEDRRRTFAQRQLAYHSGVPVDRIRSREFLKGELDRVTESEAVMARPSRFVVEHAHGMPMNAVVRRVRSMRRELKTKLVVIDYIQLAPSPDRRLKRYEAIGANMKELAVLAGKDDLAVLVLAQLGRENERERRRPILSDFRESGDIEQDGKLVLALHSTNREAPTVELCVIKNHQGPPAVMDIPYNRALCRMG
jgi:replicative DNA helicase